MIDVIVVVVVGSCTRSCKEVGLKWRRVFRLICCVTVDHRNRRTRMRGRSRDA